MLTILFYILKFYNFCILFNKCAITLNLFIKINCYQYFIKIEFNYNICFFVITYEQIKGNLTFDKVHIIYKPIINLLISILKLPKYFKCKKDYKIKRYKDFKYIRYHQASVFSVPFSNLFLLVFLECRVQGIILSRIADN